MKKPFLWGMLVGFMVGLPAFAQVGDTLLLERGALQWDQPEEARCIEVKLQDGAKLTEGIYKSALIDYDETRTGSLVFSINQAGRLEGEALISPETPGDHIQLHFFNGCYDGEIQYFKKDKLVGKAVFEKGLILQAEDYTWDGKLVQRITWAHENDKTCKTLYKEDGAIEETITYHSAANKEVIKHYNKEGVLLSLRDERSDETRLFDEKGELSFYYFSEKLPERLLQRTTEEYKEGKRSKREVVISDDSGDVRWETTHYHSNGQPKLTEQYQPKGEGVSQPLEHIVHYREDGTKEEEWIIYSQSGAKFQTRKKYDSSGNITDEQTMEYEVIMEPIG